MDAVGPAIVSGERLKRVLVSLVQQVVPGRDSSRSEHCWEAFATDLTSGNSSCELRLILSTCEWNFCASSCGSPKHALEQNRRAIARYRAQSLDIEFEGSHTKVDLYQTKDDEKQLRQSELVL